MVREGVVLSHVVSNKSIEVDKANVEVIEKLSPPTSVKGMRSFLGHIDVYQLLIKDFSNLQNLSPICLSKICLLILMKNA